MFTRSTEERETSEIRKTVHFGISDSDPDPASNVPHLAIDAVPLDILDITRDIYRLAAPTKLPPYPLVNHV